LLHGVQLCEILPFLLGTSFSVQHEIIEHMHCILQIGIYAMIAICVQDEWNNAISHDSTVAVSGLDIQAEWNGEES